MKSKFNTLGEKVFKRNISNSARFTLKVGSPVSKVFPRRSITLNSEKISSLIDQYESPPDFGTVIPEKKENTRKLVFPKLRHSKTVKLFPVKIQKRFENLNVYSKKIPQNDYMTFVMEKIPTFDLIREKNILKYKNKMLKQVSPILEDQNEYNFE